MPLMYGGTGVIPDLRGNPTNVISLYQGETWALPNDWFMVKPGAYTSIQEYDPITTSWKNIGGGSRDGVLFRTKGDGNNYRLANLTGCIVGATVTTAGSGYTTPPVVTDNASTGAVYKAIIGGAVNSTVTVTAGGSNYTYNPTVLFSAPPAGGVQATGHCTLSAGAVATVVVDNQGAGYVAPPTLTFVNDPREGLNNVTVGSGAAAIATLTGAGTVTAVIVIDPGLPVANRTTLPTLSFSTGSAAATAIMCWSIIAYNVSATTAGSGYAAPVIISGYDTAPSGSVLVNPVIQDSLVSERKAFIAGAVSGTGLSATGQTVLDGGIYIGIPTLFAYGFIPGAGAVQGVFLPPTMGGVKDTSLVLTT